MKITDWLPPHDNPTVSILELQNCLASGNFVPGFAFYLKKLNSLLDIKATLDREKLILFLYYSLDIKNKLEPFLIEGIVNTLIRLLRKKTLNLKLDWKILKGQLDVIYACKKAHQPLPGIYKHYSVLLKFATIARDYFYDSSTLVLQEYLVHVSCNALSDSIKYIMFICLLIPTRKGFSRDWVPLVFQLWKGIVQDAGIDELFMSLFARVKNATFSDRREDLLSSASRERVKNKFFTTFSDRREEKVKFLQILLFNSRAHRARE